MAKLEDELTAMLEEGYRRTGEETGYWARYYLREVRKKGGLATAKRLLGSQVEGSGFQKLINSGRIDLSLEATVLKPKFRPLFSDAELIEAQRRIDTLPDYVHRHSKEPSDNFPDEVDHREFVEGALKRITVNAFERNQVAREVCLKKHGRRCSACKMSFDERYGRKLARGFIHVHHKIPIAARHAEYELNPAKDLAPVCPNCHAMLHMTNPPMGIDELRDILQERQLA